MKFISLSTVTLLALFSSTAVEGVPRSFKELNARAPTCNTATDRACWTDGFDINTDYEENTPTTGVTRNVISNDTLDSWVPANTTQYALTITEVDNWLGPDGVVKEKVMLVNSKFTDNMKTYSDAHEDS